MTITEIRRRRAGFGLLLLCLLVPATGSAGEGGFGAWTGPGTGDPSAEAREQFLLQFEEAKLTAGDAEAGDEFGISVSIDGDAAVVGAQWADECPIDPLCGSGAAYVYRFDGISWNEEAKLSASDAAAGDKFGFSVSISGDAIVVGAPLDDNPATSAGSAYVYRFDGVSWNEEDKLTASDAAESDRYGISVSIDGDALVVGSYRDDDACFGDPICDSGSVYVYRFDGVNWNEEDKLTASDAAADDEFGISVSISGDTVVVGAFGDDDVGDFSGSAYVYRFDGASWNEEDKLTASDGALSDQFGLSVSIDGDTVVVGAYANDDVISSSGSAYVYRYNGASWPEEAKLTASDAAELDDFGWTVSVSGDTVVVGALFDDDAGADSGSAYVYRFDGVSWNEEVKLAASDAAANNKFGVSVSISGDRAVVGAYFDDDAGAQSGSAYVYRFPPRAKLTGTFVAFAACLNTTTGDLAIATVNADNASWDCEAAGLAFIPGDTLAAIGVGGVLGTDPVGGSVTGVTPIAALCDNLTVPQSVIVPIPPGDTTWDCEAGGLSVSPGNLVRVIGVGTAN